MALLSGGNKGTKDGAAEAVTLRTDGWPVTGTLDSSGKCCRKTRGQYFCLACFYPSCAPYFVPSVFAYGLGAETVLWIWVTMAAVTPRKQQLQVGTAVVPQGWCARFNLVRGQHCFHTERPIIYATYIHANTMSWWGALCVWVHMRCVRRYDVTE